MKIAITGGIGAGKSTLMAHLRDVFPHARFCSMDAFVDALYQAPDWLAWLREQFGTDERSEISRLAFANRAVLSQLNAQSALAIGVKLGRLLSSEGLVFVEFPLLFESGLGSEFDRTILITADRDVRIARVVARGKKTAEQAGAVLDAQMTEIRKAQMAHAVIDTSRAGTQDACALQLVDAIQSFLSGQTS